MTEGRTGEPDDDRVPPDAVALPVTPRQPRSAGAAALGRAMLGLGDIIEGKPPREVYEHVVESDEAGEPVDPRLLTIDLTPTDPPG
ncbi:MAG TPA: hypothetical protein VGO78_05815 [Acidimicrobiales bacterium]|nr:hypothetical protein [Acidimicrobiales bacterium]